MTHRDDGYDDKLTDVVDIAGVAEARDRSAALAAVQRKAKPQQLPRQDGSFEFTDCDDCGDDIGEARLKVAAMNRLCIFCATKRERRQ